MWSDCAIDTHLDTYGALPGIAGGRQNRAFFSFT